MRMKWIKLHEPRLLSVYIVLVRINNWNTISGKNTFHQCYLEVIGSQQLFHWTLIDIYEVIADIFFLLLIIYPFHGQKLTDQWLNQNFQPQELYMWVQPFGDTTKSPLDGLPLKGHFYFPHTTREIQVVFSIHMTPIGWQKHLLVRILRMFHHMMGHQMKGIKLTPEKVRQMQHCWLSNKNNFFQSSVIRNKIYTTVIIILRN